VTKQINNVSSTETTNNNRIIQMNFTDRTPMLQTTPIQLNSRLNYHLIPSF